MWKGNNVCRIQVGAHVFHVVTCSEFGSHDGPKLFKELFSLLDSGLWGPIALEMELAIAATR